MIIYRPIIQGTGQTQSPLTIQIIQEATPRVGCTCMDVSVKDRRELCGDRGNSARFDSTVQLPKPGFLCPSRNGVLPMNTSYLIVLSLTSS